MEQEIELTTVPDFWPDGDGKGGSQKWLPVYQYGLAHPGEIVQVTLASAEEAKRCVMALRAKKTLKVSRVQKKNRTVRFMVEPLA